MVVQQSSGLKKCFGYRYLGVPAHYAPTTAFSKDSSAKDGLQNRCKECRREYSKWHNPTLYGKYKDRFIRYKHKKRGLPYDPAVTREAIYTFSLGVCHICGKHVPVAKGRWVAEHRNGEEGWVWSNMRLAHPHCNTRKNSTKMEILSDSGVLQEMRDPLYTGSVQLALTSGEKCGIMELEGQTRREFDGILGV